MVDSLIYYLKFTKILTNIGFEINPYDLCVANKVIDGSHITIFRVDDCKLSHRERKSDDCMIKWLWQEYEIIFEYVSGKMSVIRGKFHKYIGMTLYYNVCGQVSITVFSYI